MLGHTLAFRPPSIGIRKYPAMPLAQKYAIRQQPEARLVPRSGQSGWFNGNHIDVVTGYDAGEDRFAVHAYITAVDGVRRKLPMVENLADSERDGFAKGWAAIDAFFAG